MNKLTIDGQTIRFASYTTERYAIDARERSYPNKAWRGMLVLGDNGQYWLTTPANAERLVRAGYEYAPR